MIFSVIKRVISVLSVNDLVVALFLPLIFSLFVPLTGDYKFVIHVLFISFIIGFSENFRLDKQVCDLPFTMAFAFLLFISITSIFKNGLASSINGLAQYASYLILYIAIKNYSYIKENVSFLTKVLGWTFVVNLLYVVIGILIIDDQSPNSWATVFYNNQNQTLVTLLFLFPFFITSENRNWLKIILTCLLAFLIYFSNSSGAKLIFVSIFIFYLFTIKNWISPFYLLIFFIGVFFVSLFSDENRKIEFVHSTKVVMIHPILGFGINMWDEAFNFHDISDLKQSSDHTFRKRELYRNISHNKYSTIMVECGAIGFFLFFFPFFYQMLFFDGQEILMPYYLTIFIFLIACVIYSFPISDIRYFSSLYYCVIISLGINANYKQFDF